MTNTNDNKEPEIYSKRPVISQDVAYELLEALKRAACAWWQTGMPVPEWIKAPIAKAEGKNV